MPFRTFDAFDLPDWVGTHAVTWTPETSLTERPSVLGELTAEPALSQQLDLLAVDAAYPTPMCPEEHRRLAHQAWQYGQVALVEVDGRVACAVPGTGFGPDLACEVIRRVAKSVGAPAKNFTVSIVL